MTPAPNLPVFLLLFAQSPTNSQLKELKRESTIIRDLFLPLDKSGRIKLLREESAQRDDVIRLLAEFKDRIHILHFGGHAHGQGLFLEDERARASGLAGLLQVQKNIKLVFLNGCHTQAQAERYLDAGIPMVIATTQALPDKDATLFSDYFYHALTREYSVEEAFRSATSALRLKSGRYDFEAEEIVTYRGMGRDSGFFQEKLPWRLYVNQEQAEALSWRLPSGSAEQQLSLEEEKRLFSAYAEWLKKEYNTISLPAIKEGQDLPRIPLEQVYVALKVSGKSTNRELELSHQQMMRNYEDLLNELEHEPSPEDQRRIYEDVLQQSDLLKAWDEKRKMALSLEIDKEESLSRRDSQESINLAEAFQNERYLVILGDPGSGKSTLVKWLCLNISNALKQQLETGEEQLVQVSRQQVDVLHNEEEQIALGPARMPILLRIADYARFYEYTKKNEPTKSRGIIDYLGYHLSDSESIDATLFNQLIREYLRADKAVVFLDGLDEVTNNRNDILREVNSFIDHWIRKHQRAGSSSRVFAPGGIPAETGGNQLVVTSRIVGYQAAPLSGGLTHVTIQKMEEAAVRHFCHIWIKSLYLSQFPQGHTDTLPATVTQEIKLLQEAIFDDAKPRIRELATNPLLVTILAVIFRHQHGKLPESRAELYQRALDALLGKWQQRNSIPLKELKTLLAPLAAHMHKNLADDIRETDLIYFLEVELSRIRGGQPGEEVSAEISSEVAVFVQRAKADVGLLAERGEKLYHFLHRTFQEYLAGLNLIADKRKASEAILDCIEDPIWREPILLALGYADLQWPSSQFEDLIETLLFADDPLLDLIPRTSLFIANAIPELENLSERVILALLHQLLGAYSAREDVYRNRKIQQEISGAFQKIKQGRKGVVLNTFLYDILASPPSADVWVGAIALIREQGWWDPCWFDLIIQHIELDQAAWGWPANQLLQANCADIEEQLNIRNLPMRTRLLQYPDWLAFVQGDTAWLRLLGALYGGWEQHPRIDAFFENLTNRWLLELGLRTVDDHYKESTRLTEIENEFVTEIQESPYVFNPRFIYRDGPFTRRLLRSIKQKEPAAKLESYFLEQLEKPESPEVKALALLGLSSIGYNTASLVYQFQLNHTNGKVISRFIAHLDRVQESIKTAVTATYFFFLKKNQELESTSWNNVPKHRQWDIYQSLQFILAKNKLPPLHYGYLDINKRPWIMEEKEQDSFLAAGLEAGYFLGLTAMLGEDTYYSSMVVLDTLGGRFQKNHKLLVSALNALPESQVLKTNYRREWKAPSFYFTPNESGQLMFALQVLDGLPSKYDYLREWFIVTVWPQLEEKPAFKPYAYALLFLSGYQDRIRKLAPELFDHRNKIAAMIELIEAVSIPYCRFLAAGKMFRLTFHQSFLKIYLQAFAELKQPDALLLGTFDLIDLLSSSSADSFRYFKQESEETEVLKKDVYAGLLNRAEVVIPQMGILENKIKAWCYISDLQLDEEQAQAFVFRAMDTLPLLEKDDSQTYYLKFILENYGLVAQRYPHWDKINAAFTDQWELNKALGKSYLNWYSLDHIAEKEAGSGKNTAVPDLWAILGLSACNLELHYRFAQRDILSKLWQRITIGEDRQQAVNELQKIGRDGVILDIQALYAVNRLVEKGAEPELNTILPLLEQPTASVRPLIETWLEHENPKLNQLYALLETEDGRLSPAIIQGLIACLESDFDRIRFRAMIAIHGADPSSGQDNRSFYTANLSIECFAYIAQLLYQSDSISRMVVQVFGWLSHNLVHNDPKLIDYAVQLLKSKKEVDQDTGYYILNSGERITNAVWQRVLYWLYLAEPSEEPLLKALLRCVSRQCYLDKVYLSELQPSPKNIRNYLGENQLVVLEDKIVLPISVNILRNVLFTVLELNDPGNKQDNLQLLRETLNEQIRIDFRAAYLAGDFAFYLTMRKGGSGLYVSTDSYQQEAKAFAEELIENLPALKLLVEWTIEELDEELIDYKNSTAVGGYLSIIAANIAIHRPEIFLSLIDVDYVKKLLSDVVDDHNFWFARQGAIGLLASTNKLDEEILSAFEKALKDVSYPREQARRSFVYLTSFDKEQIIDKLLMNVETNTGLMSQLSIFMLSEMCRDDKIKPLTRKKIINQLAEILRRAIKDPLKRRAIYTREPYRQKPTYLTSIDTVLFDELSKIIGLS